MKLCLIAPVAPPYGGVSNWERIVEKAIKNDSDIELSIINIAANKRSIDGRSIFDRIFYSGYVMIKACWELRKLIRQGKIEHVHMTTSGGLGFYRDILLLKILHKKKIPATYHIHFGRAIHYYEEKNKNWKLLLKATSMATNVITIDEKTYKLLSKHVNNVVCINNPVNVEAFTKYEETTEKKIVYVGWIIKPKGIEELIQAFQIFNSKSNAKYVLELVGRGQDEYIEYLKNTYDCKNVLFVGEVDHDQAMRHIAGGEFFVLPSYTEGSPNVILEAMVLGKPIIATDVGSIPYMLDSDSGLLIEPKSINSIVDALTLLDMDMCKKDLLSRKAQSRVKEMFDISVIYKMYKEMWMTCNKERKENT